ncbi:MAG TPA: HD domain-containing phosphohydrolase [Thermoleophilaceae bacterium]
MTRRGEPRTSNSPDQPPEARTGEAINVVSRLLAAATAAERPDALAGALAREARAYFRVSAVMVFVVDQRSGRAVVVAADPAPPHRDWFGLDEASPLAEVLLAGAPTRLSTAQARELALASGLQPRPQAALVAPMAHPGGALAHVLLIADEHPRAFDEADLAAAAALAEAARASLAQQMLAEEHGAQRARQSAIARAAKALNESLDLTRVLPRICEEAAGILGADRVLVFRGTAGSALALEASSVAHDGGAGTVEHAGGIAGRALELGRPIISNDYVRDAAPTVGSAFADVRMALAVPMRWDGELRGVMWAGWASDRLVVDEDAQLLESFAELAAVACRNASVHADLAEAARTDALTGCMNHAALHETLRREMQRSRRTGRSLTVVLIDLDDFKQVNERQGHLAGDEVLRRVGRALRQAVRPYDFVARYGGDEFAIVSVDSEEGRGGEIARRAIQRLSESVAELGHDKVTTYATAGVAEWTAGLSPSELLREADRALLYGKQRGIRGAAIAASSVPDDFRLGRPAEPGETPAPSPERVVGPRTLDGEPLRKRNRQLTLANALGARLSEMTGVQEILEAAVEELHRAFGYLTCAVMRPVDEETIEAVAGRGAAFERLTEPWRQSRASGVIGRCLRERRTIVVGDTSADPDYFATESTTAVRSELVSPIWVGSELWGAIDVQEAAAEAFDEADARLIETVADQLGAALRSATLYEQLERAYIGTAEALAAALEAKDAHTANHARSLVRNAEAIGKLLGLGGVALRDIRYGAAFHDIGKIAVPESILNKPGPLTDEERAQVERHVLVGEQILAPVEFLTGVRPLVRHGHERWDGTGYPDRLAGEEVPLGARIILACDAYDAMTSDRPYRSAMSRPAAREELRRYSGSQFDPAVVSALLEVLDRQEAPTLESRM